MVASRMVIGVLALLCSAAGLAQSTDYASRAEALKDLTATETERRADAVLWIASHGKPADEAELRKLLVDDNPLIRELAENGVRRLWTRSGDEKVDALMAKGNEQMEAGDLGEAFATYSDVIKRRPEFAEGWNKRAAVLFLAGDFKRSLADCSQVIKRNPNHFGALAGYGHIYFRLEEYEKAIRYWQRALDANPNLANLEDNIAIAEKLLAARRRNMV